MFEEMKLIEIENTKLFAVEDSCHILKSPTLLSSENFRSEIYTFGLRASFQNIFDFCF